MSAPTMLTAALKETTYQNPQNPTDAHGKAHGHAEEKKNRQQDENAQDAEQGQAHCFFTSPGQKVLRNSVRKTRARTTQPSATPQVKG